MAKIVYEIPVRPEPQTFSIVVRDRVYRFLTQYREEGELGWILDIDSEDTGKTLVRGIPLVAGLDLLWQYNYLLFGFSLIMQCQEGRTTPTFESLGVRDKLLIVIDSTHPSVRTQIRVRPPWIPLDLEVYPPVPGG